MSYGKHPCDFCPDQVTISHCMCRCECDKHICRRCWQTVEQVVEVNSEFGKYDAWNKYICQDCGKGQCKEEALL